MEEHATVASPRVGGTDPSPSWQGDRGIGSPGAFQVIGLEADERWQVSIPCVLGGDAIGRAIHGEQIVLLGGEGMGCDAPGLEVGEAWDTTSDGEIGRRRGEGDADEEPDDGNGDEAFDDGKGRTGWMWRDEHGEGVVHRAIGVTHGGRECSTWNIVRVRGVRPDENPRYQYVP